MRVSEVMSRHPAVCTGASSAQTAAGIMKEHGTGIVPVVEDNYSQRLAGVVTDRDLCLWVIAAGRDPNHAWVEDCMTAEPVFCVAEDTVETVLEIMKQHLVRRVPVVDNEKAVIGMVSLSDLVRHNAINATELLALLKKMFAKKVAKRAA